MVNRFISAAVLGVSALALAAPAANAADLALNYTVSTNPDSSYHYDFSLALTNGDGGWAPGQQWDWIIFGDKVGGYSGTSGFCPITCSASSFYNFTSTDPNASLVTSGGGHQGPTISYAGSVVLPGWQPAGVGSTLNWSGDSAIYLGAGQLAWSTLQYSQGAHPADFAIANATDGAVPEPATWAMMLIGFAAVGGALRSRRRSQHATVRYA